MRLFTRKAVIKAVVTSKVTLDHSFFKYRGEKLEPTQNVAIQWSYSFPVWAQQAQPEAWRAEMVAQFERHLDEVAEALK